MGKTPRKHTPAFKAKVVLDLLKEIETIPQLCSKYQIHPTQARRWKNEAITGLMMTFTMKPDRDQQEQQQLVAELYQRIGELNVQLDWLKKKTGLTPGP